MDRREREVILGAIVFVAIVMVVVGSMWLSERFAGAAGGYRLVATFDSVLGLHRGAEVTIRGVNVGKVLEIGIDGGQPQVVIGFYSVRSLPKDSKVLMKGEGVLGEQSIEVQVGSSSEVFADGDRVRGAATKGLEDITIQAAAMADDLKRAVDKVVNEKNLSHIENVLSQMDSAALSLKTTLEENRESISRAIDSMALASGQARGILSDNREGMQQSVENLRKATEKLAVMSENLQGASESMREMFDNLNVVTKKLRDGKGTLGRLLQEDSVYEELEGTLVSVDSLIENIKRDPSKYLNFQFSIF